MKMLGHNHVGYIIRFLTWVWKLQMASVNFVVFKLMHKVNRDSDPFSRNLGFTCIHSDLRCSYSLKNSNRVHTYFI